MKCIYCGSENIETITPQKGGNFYLSAVNDDLEPSTDGLLLIVERCVECGKVSFSAPDIKKFLSL